MSKALDPSYPNSRLPDVRLTKTLSIKTRITVTVLLMLALGVATGWVSFHSMRAVQDRVDISSRFYLPLTRIISRIGRLEEEQDDWFVQALLEAKDNAASFDLPQARERIDRLDDEVARGKQMVSAVLEDHNLIIDRRGLADILDQFNQVQKRQQHIDGQLDQWPVAISGVAQILPKDVGMQILKEVTELQAGMAQLVQAVERVTEDSVNEARSEGEWGLLVLVCLLLFSLLIALLLGGFVAKSIIQPLRHAQHIAQEIAAGHLDVRFQKVSADELGQLLGALESMMEAVRERERMEQLLHQAETRSQVGQLALGMAHEINNPLANAVMNLQLLGLELRGLPDPARANHLLEVIDRNLGRAVGITRELLSFSRPQQLSLSPINVQDPLDGALLLMEPRLKGVRISRAATAVPDVLGLYGKLEQLFVNLLQNAVDAMPEGGELQISSEYQDGWVSVRIKDSGCGVPEALRDRIGEPFFSTKKDGVHVGLGLTICNSIVSQHGGSLVLEPAEGGGTLASVRLPVASPVGRGTAAIRVER